MFLLYPTDVSVQTIYCLAVSKHTGLENNLGLYLKTSD